jgi:rhodanese-related sulfurtransferase
MNAEDLENLVRETDILITVSDAREYFGGCIPGWQAFSIRFGFDWKETMRRGIPASKLLETKDVMAYNLVTHVYTRERAL